MSDQDRPIYRYRMKNMRDPKYNGRYAAFLSPLDVSMDIGDLVSEAEYMEGKAKEYEALKKESEATS